MPHHNIGEHSPFLKRVLVPFWVIRIIIMGINIASMGIAIAALAYVNSNRDRYSNELEELKSNYNVQQALSVAIVILVVQMVLVLICLAGDIACIIKRSRRTLTPKFFLGVNIFQSLFWVVSFILSMLGARTVVSIVINIVVLLVSPCAPPWILISQSSILTIESTQVFFRRSSHLRLHHLPQGAHRKAAQPAREPPDARQEQRRDRLLPAD